MGIHQYNVTGPDTDVSISCCSSPQLPLDLQERVKAQLSPDEVICMEEAANQNEAKMIRVPMPTFPPTAMLYSVPRVIVPPETSSKVDTVPTTLIARVLAKPESKRRPRVFYVCNECRRDFMCVHRETQTGSANRDSFSVKNRPPCINGHSVSNTDMHHANSVETQI